MLVLDTSSVPAPERADAYQSAVSANCSSSMAIFEDASSFGAELHAYDFGPATIFNIEASGNSLRRTSQMARAADKCEITLALPMRTTNRLSWRQREDVYGPAELMLVDLSAPYVYRWEGEGASYALHVDYEALGLPMDVIYRASDRLRSSPLYPLVRDHVANLVTNAQLIEESGQAARVGAASAELMHALIVSAAGDTQRLDDSLHESLTARIQAYVQLHLGDPTLSAAGIAVANGISVRKLYELYESMELSLEQSIIEQRLLGARADLSARRQRYDSIGAVARAWGFSSPSFFSARFRQRFAMSPRECRDMASAQQPGAPEEAPG